MIVSVSVLSGTVISIDIFWNRQISVSILQGMIVCVLSGMVISAYYLEWERRGHSAEVVREWLAGRLLCAKNVCSLKF
jgi:hypothetical protein